MTGKPLALVLMGGLGIIAAAVALLVRRRAAAPIEASPERTTPNLGSDTILGSGERAHVVGASAGSSVPQEPPELCAARDQAHHQLQVLSFGKLFATLPAGVLQGSVAAPGLAPESHRVVAAIRTTLAGIVERPNYAPRRPLLLPKLMQAMNDDETSRRELARIIATDPALAGNLLRLANSPFYRIQREPVESLDRAIALLGLEGMRSLIASALLQPVFRISGGLFLQFGEITWEHTLHSASAAEAHAAVLEHSDPFAAQLLALILGLATIVVFRVSTDEFLAHQLSPSAALLGALIDAEAATVARRIAASWELSERIDTALADQLAVAGQPMSRLGRALQMGRFLGALALLQARGLLSEEEAQAAIRTAGQQAEACLRIFSRLRGLPASV